MYLLCADCRSFMKHLRFTGLDAGRMAEKDDY